MNKLIALLLFTIPGFAQFQQQEMDWPDHSGRYDQGLSGPYGSYWEDTLTFDKYNAHLALNHITIEISIRSRHRWEYQNIAPPMNAPVLITDRNELLLLYVIDDAGVETLVATLNSPINDQRTVANLLGHALSPWRTFSNNSKVFTITDDPAKALFVGPGEVHLKITSLNNVSIASNSHLFIWYAKTVTRGRVLMDYFQ